MTSTYITGNWITAIGRLVRQGPASYTWAWTDRQQQYAAWDAYYSNAIYESITNGGQRENINSILGNAAAADLAGLYNPIASVVDLYLHTLGGALGDEITIESDNSALIDPIDRLWQWSNLTIEKQLLCRWAANHGCVGLRVVARDDADLTKRRVYLKVEHPRIIKDAQLDNRGNVEAILLEWCEQEGLGEAAKEVEYREELTQTSFRKWKLSQGTAVETIYDTENVLGVVPYVLLRHEMDGTAWGRNAWYKARPGIDRLNALASHIDVQIHRHVRAKWFIAAAGAAPTEIDMGDMTVAYSNTHNSSSTPMIAPLVAPLNLADAILQAKTSQGWIEDQLPELKATQGQFLAGQSGETIAELRKPAEDRLALARSNYEDALVRAQKIALSYGVLLGLWDLGTGIETPEAAERAYQSGAEDHAFNKRPLLSADAQPDQPVATKQPETGRTLPSQQVPANNGQV